MPVLYYFWKNICKELKFWIKKLLRKLKFILEISFKWNGHGKNNLYFGILLYLLLGHPYLNIWSFTDIKDTMDPSSLVRHLLTSWLPVWQLHSAHLTRSSLRSILWLPFYRPTFKSKCGKISRAALNDNSLVREWLFLQQNYERTVLRTQKQNQLGMKISKST